MRYPYLGWAFLLLCAPLQAAASDPLFDGGKLCTQHIPTVERHYQIPLHLLSAISSAESGRWHKKLGVFVPWPWTINVEGKGYFFDTKAEAIARTAALLKQGKRSIDVGCMQVNLKHHPTAFASLEEAFSPAHNVAYAAKFLRERFARTGDWVQAAAHYHSRTPSLGKRYLARVKERWEHIISRVRMAASSTSAGYKVVQPNNPLGAGRYGGRAPQSRGVKKIEVSQHTDAPHDVLVVKPTKTVLATTVPGAAAQERMALLVKGSALRPITKRSVDNRNGSTHRIPSTQFIFSN
jgi:hypothetical protein